MPKAPASPKTIAANVRPFPNAATKEALSTFTAALEAMQSGHFQKALDRFNALDDGSPPEVRERAHVYAAACARQLQVREISFQTIDEQFDYAVSRMNTGDYEEAREHLEAIVETEPNTDYAHYGLAMLYSITNQAEPCLHHLARSIELNGHNRLQARSDNDFRQMADDPRFTELLYPEAAI